ncbi:Acetolactate synthase isozyme 1 large subunit [compost metagenome]
MGSGVDLLIVLGSKLSDFITVGFPKDFKPNKVLHFDINYKYVNKSFKAPTVFVYGDIDTNLRSILRNIKDINKKNPGNFQRADYSPPVKDGRGLYIADIAQSLSSHMNADLNSLVVADEGSNGFTSMRYFSLNVPGTFIFDTDLACMGYAIGYSIGAKLGNPNLNVTCITGDGCIFMLGTELSTAVNENIPVIFVVINNKQLDMATKGMERSTGRTDGTIFKVPLDVSMFAKSMGAEAFICDSIEKFDESYVIAKNLNKPVVIEVLADTAESPPTESRNIKID